MKIVTQEKTVYTFSPDNKPAAHVKAGELVMLRMGDAFGGQIQDESTPIHSLDWSKVDGATGPLYFENAKLGDTLAVEIVSLKTDSKGVTVTIPRNGILRRRKIAPAIKISTIKDGYINFGRGAKVKVNPMIGTIGVAPASGSVPSSSLGKHGGNMDVKEMTAGKTLYLPVFTEGALFAAGDMHAVQADGELCVSAVEVTGEAEFRFRVIKGKKPYWPVLESDESFSVLACGETLEEAASAATEAAVKGLMREHDWSFEEAYMFGSIAVNLEINQVVDVKKGIRATVSKDYITLESLLC
jgi:amidase